MSDLAIRVENLGKRYRIGGRQERYKRFTETVMDTFAAPIRRLRNLGKPTPPEEIIWALKDVSFEVERGEVLGIIGRNGAGKTTLLKILSRITEPTEGRAEIHGRVGSLLEVGTGFHPELTGRENIYLNGAILGMRRAEIDAKFDEIVAFSEIEKFLDTPVKRYSSGMRVRLAFAVAAHLEPEIMLVDEVLAVGDAQFQKKCLGKMGEVAGEGRTVLFVSHNMVAIQKLCNRGVLFEAGRLMQDGQASKVISSYLSDDFHADWSRRADHLVRFREPRGINRIAYFRIDTPFQRDVLTLLSGTDIELVFGCQGDGMSQDLLVSWVVQDPTGRQLLLQHNRLEGTKLRTTHGLSEVVCRIQHLPLPASDYRIYVQLWIGGDLVDETNTERFSVQAGGFFGTGLTVDARNALLLTRASWFQRVVNTPGAKNGTCQDASY